MAIDAAEMSNDLMMKMIMEKTDTEETAEEAEVVEETNISCWSGLKTTVARSLDHYYREDYGRGLCLV